MVAMTRFWLLRHGEPAAEARARCYGSLDIGLSEHGRAQMQRAAEWMANESLAMVYSSPRARSLEGARMIAAARQCAVEIVPEFREIDFGEFEGLTYDRIASQYPDIYRQWMERPTDVQFPGGESFAQMKTRVLDAFTRIQGKHDGQTAAIVSHGGVNRILIARALQMPDDCIFRLAQDYGAINLIAWIDASPSVRLVNWGGH